MICLLKCIKKSLFYQLHVRTLLGLEEYRETKNHRYTKIYNKRAWYDIYDKIYTKTCTVDRDLDIGIGKWHICGS